MNELLPSLVLVLPLFGATLGLIFYQSLRAQRLLCSLVSLLLVVCTTWLLLRVSWFGVQSFQMGNWMAPFGISIVVDLLSALFLWACSIVALCTAMSAMVGIRATYLRGGFVPVFFTLLLGVNGALMTADLFNLFVWFEVMLISSFVLLSMGGTRPQAEAALKYVALNLLSSIFFLSGVGLLYALTGSLNMIDVGMQLLELQETDASLILGISLLFIFSFGLKAGIFPLYSWLPASYHTPPTAITALFAGLLTKVGVFCFYRVFSLVFPPQQLFFEMMSVIAILTMLFGVWGAVCQKDIRKILSFHIISQIGYAIMGLALLGSPDPLIRELGLAAAIFFVLHNIFAKSNLFLIGGLIDRYSGTQELSKLGGYLSWKPFLAGIFLISSLSLAGIPPLSGFWAKLGLLQAGFGAGAYLMCGAALFTGIFTLISMMKIWNASFLGKVDKEREPRPLNGSERFVFYSPVVILASMTLWLGLFPQSIYRLSAEAASQLQRPEVYRFILDQGDRLEVDPEYFENSSEVEESLDEEASL